MRTATVILLAAIGARILLEANKEDSKAKFGDIPFFGDAIGSAVVDAGSANIRNGLDIAIVGAGLLWIL